MKSKLNKSNKFNFQKIQTEIAMWVSRERFEISVDYDKKIYDRLKRKYKLEIDINLLKEKIELYQNIYSVISEILPIYIIPSESGCAEPHHVKRKDIIDFASKKFTNVHKIVLTEIIDWVIEYQYFR